MMPNKYGVKCPECKSTAIWRISSIPTREGHKYRYKCTRCAKTFFVKGHMVEAAKAKTAKAPTKRTIRKKAG
jgi:transposase-like protein